MKLATESVTENSPEATLLPASTHEACRVGTTGGAPYRVTLHIGSAVMFMEPDDAEAIGAALLTNSTVARTKANAAETEEA